MIHTDSAWSLAKCDAPDGECHPAEVPVGSDQVKGRSEPGGPRAGEGTEYPTPVLPVEQAIHLQWTSLCHGGRKGQR